MIGIVGGIGSGKSTVANTFAQLGGTVIDGDRAGHAALRVPNIRDQIARRWPSAVQSDGEIDRASLGRIVFADPSQLRELEGIVFPFIKTLLQAEIAAAKRDGPFEFIILDAAVMLEAGWSSVCDRLVFVESSQELRQARVANRGWSPEDLARRERSQLSLDEKRRRCDAVIVNDSDLGSVERQVHELKCKWRVGKP